jgi:hypothetical protein
MQEAFSFGIEVEPRTVELLKPKTAAAKPPVKQKPEAKAKKKKSSLWDIEEDDIESLTDEELNQELGGADGNFILDAMSEAYDEDTKTIRDLKIDDRDLPRAKNYLHYCTDIAGKSVKIPFARQLWSMVLGLAEYCPKCTKPKWYSDIYNIPVDMEIKDLVKRLILLENGKCPKCGTSKSELILHGDLVPYNSIAMCWGQRSGKTSVATTVSTYHLHCLLKAPKLSTICRGIQDFTPLTYTFVGLSAARAIRLSWNPVRDLLNNSQWYKDYYAMLKFNQVKYGIELLKTGVLGTRFLHKNIDLYPLGPLKRQLRGDCLTGDVMINTSDGFLHFDELNIPLGLTPSKLKVDSLTGTKDVSHVYAKASRSIFEITTLNGIKIGCTPEHPMLVMRPDLSFAWVRADSIKEGDYIVSRTNRSRPMFGSNELTIDQATILGTFTANGYRNEITSGDPAVVSRFTKAASRLGYHIRARGEDVKNISVASYGVFVNDKPSPNNSSFTKVLESWGYTNCLSAEKQIPTSVRTAPREVLHEYLEAYFACDGHINGGPTKKAKLRGTDTGVEVELASASEKLIRQLQTILLQVYGLVGRVHKSVEFKSMGRNKQNAPKHYTTWLLTLTGHDAYLFSETFKRAKVNRFKDRIKSAPPGYASDRRAVPYLRRVVLNLWYSAPPRSKYFVSPDGEKLVRPAPMRLIKNSRPKSKIRGNTIDGRVPEFLAYERPDVLEFLAKMHPEFASGLRTLYKLQPHFERVTSVVKQTGKVTVFDVTVPDGHAFYANGLTSHNTRALSSVEEIGIFPIVNTASDEMEEDEEREHANADEVWQSLENSLMTVREEVSHLYRKGINTIPMALNLAISSPMSKKDKMCRLLEEAKNPDAMMLGLQLPTWDINPFMPRDSATIKSAYAKNPEKAERDFGANPPVLSAATFTSQQVVGLFSNDRRNEHRIVYDADEKNLGRTLAHFLKEGTKSVWEPHILSLDAGLTNNAFALALGYRKASTLVVTSILEVVARPGTKINFPYLYKHVILPMVKDCNVVIVGADRWNSIDMLQQLTEDTANKVKTLQLSLQPKHFPYFETAVDNGSLDLPMLSMTPEEVMLSQNFKKDFVGKPIDHLLLQFMTVKYVMGVLTKGEGYTDDMLRALTVLYILAFNPKLHEYTTKFATIGSGEGTDDQKKVTRGIVLSGFRSPAMQHYNSHNR